MIHGVCASKVMVQTCFEYMSFFNKHQKPMHSDYKLKSERLGVSEVSHTTKTIIQVEVVVT